MPALGVLLRSLIFEREPIYREQETVHGFASGLFGVDAQAMEHLSHDRLGRALDRLFDADRAALLNEIILAVAERSPCASMSCTTTARRSASLATIEPPRGE